MHEAQEVNYKNNKERDEMVLLKFHQIKGFLNHVVKLLRIFVFSSLHRSFKNIFLKQKLSLDKQQKILYFCTLIFTTEQ